jgi:hypothetical protein
VISLDGDNVRVPVEQERILGSGALQAGDDIPSAGFKFDHNRRQVLSIQNGSEVAGCLEFVAWRIDRIDTD